MRFNPSKLNLYMFFKLPAAFWCGVRAVAVTETVCKSSVRYKWFNQNPFGSVYFAVLAMAAEFTTGVLVMQEIKKSNKNISMLVLNLSANFSKKAKGKILFSCVDGQLIKDVVKKAIESNEGQTIWLSSIGIDEKNDQVALFKFEWSIKVK